MKKVIITGGGSGIGKDLAIKMYLKGYTLSLTGRNLAKLEAVKKEILALNSSANNKVFTASLDVMDTDKVFSVIKDLHSQMGGLDIVVVNAGIGYSNKVGKARFERDIATAKTNFIGAMATVQASAYIFKKQKSGHVVGISSVISLRGMPGYGAYSGSKAAFSNYLSSARFDLKRFNVKVSDIHPGFIDTPLLVDKSRAPFVIGVDQCGKAIMKVIDAEKKHAYIPFKWNFIAPFMKYLPDAIIGRLM